MSIADELREWAKGFEYVWFKPASKEVVITTGGSMPVDHVNMRLFIEGIADRIDAEHERICGEKWLMGYHECHAELMEGNEVIAKDLERCGWVRKENRRTISTCCINVEMHFNWEKMAQELEQFAETVRGMAGDAE